MSIRYGFYVTLYDEGGSRPVPFDQLDAWADYDCMADGSIEIAAVGAYYDDAEPVVTSGNPLWHAVMDAAEKQLDPKNIDSRGRNTLDEITEKLFDSISDCCGDESAAMRGFSAARAPFADAPITL